MAPSGRPGKSPHRTPCRGLFGSAGAVWLSVPTALLSCARLFRPFAHDHTTGMELHRDPLPNSCFSALGNGAPIDFEDAGSDRRTSSCSKHLAPSRISTSISFRSISRGRLLARLTVGSAASGDHAASCGHFATLTVCWRCLSAVAAPLRCLAGVAILGRRRRQRRPFESFGRRHSRLEQTLNAGIPPLTT